MAFEHVLTNMFASLFDGNPRTDLGPRYNFGLPLWSGAEFDVLALKNPAPE
jgi:hypothetical protein